MENVSAFGERLTELMVINNIDTAHLAAALGVHATTVQRWRRGTKYLFLSQLVKLADYFDCSGFSHGKNGYRFRLFTQAVPALLCAFPRGDGGEGNYALPHEQGNENQGFLFYRVEQGDRPAPVFPDRGRRLPQRFGGLSRGQGAMIRAKEKTSHPRYFA